jgi:hypothetical protein
LHGSTSTSGLYTSSASSILASTHPLPASSASTVSIISILGALALPRLTVRLTPLPASALLLFA